MAKAAPLKVVCAWCKKVTREGEAPGGLVSHGICEDCRDAEVTRFRKRLAKKLKDVIR